MVSRVEAQSGKVSNFACEARRRESIQVRCYGNMSYFALEKVLVLFLRKYIFISNISRLLIEDCLSGSACGIMQCGLTCGHCSRDQKIETEEAACLLLTKLTETEVMRLFSNLWNYNAVWTFFARYEWPGHYYSTHYIRLEKHISRSLQMYITFEYMFL
jgi:hypothetical protein